MREDCRLTTLAAGSGGIDSAKFINDVFMPYFKDIMESCGEDAGVFDYQSSKYIVSSDSYVVNPIFFNGGDIGKLCVCGSANDVAMMGGRPLYITIGFIIEEGFDISKLERIADSIRSECLKLNLRILSADTKVLPRFSADPNIFINTACIGGLARDGISVKNISHGDSIIINGNIGAHGCSIFLDQNHMDISADIKSDCASLYPMLEPLFESDIPLRALRDATRGGLSSVLNEWAIESKSCAHIYEDSVGIDAQVGGVCEILGLDAMNLANEGICVISLPSEYENMALEILRRHDLGAEARVIGRISKDAEDSRNFGKVILHTKYGGKRYAEYPQGELLPRIC